MTEDATDCIVPNCERPRSGAGPFAGALCAEHAQGIESPAKRKSKPVDYLTVEQRFRLNEACRALNECFRANGFGVFLVGSVMERPDFRDVDVRAIVRDETFAQLYPKADPKAPARDPYWALSMVAFSAYLREATGLPVDFQVQQQTAANEEFPGPRNAIGIGLAQRMAHRSPADEQLTKENEALRLALESERKAREAAEAYFASKASPGAGTDAGEGKP